ncbi:alanine racemase [Rhodobaculum claviforme]|uniref:ornithine decarboxylase n=1 Tax=Rhodobaculum claviforme TaxID=1549854 RepID=A0A934TJM4_9RHOB|nr:alanine racemase [Rhodobaculum claviforme]MBK5927319.1 ornithine decarboxylase [Rhodobaculum claviforme]
MGLAKTIWDTPADYLHHRAEAEAPVLFFAPAALQGIARRFIAGFPGLVTYAVKANPDAEVIANLAAAGVRGFDVASPEEMALVRRLVPDAALHYNNPVRSRREIAQAVALDVVSYSVDSHSELAKLTEALPAGTEVTVRFKLPVSGAAYDFGAKFGAEPAAAAALLAEVAAHGLTPALTFHPGTQCTDPRAWAAYIHAAARIGRDAGVRVARLNVGGGFPSHRRAAEAPALDAIFATIAAETAAAFGDDAPALVCEPGRALVADAFTLATQVKAVRDGGAVFLNDGVYGALAEAPVMGLPDRIELRAPGGARRTGWPRPREVFGPTCDSIDRLPGHVPLPCDIAEGDHLLFHGMGAYSTVTNTRFNGFGGLLLVTVLELTDRAS